MKRNPYRRALEADQAAERQPWEESAFSRAVADRAKILDRQERLSWVLLSIALGLGLPGAALIWAGFAHAGLIVFASGLLVLCALAVFTVWETVSAWRNALMLEAALIRGSAEAHGNDRKRQGSDAQD